MLASTNFLLVYLPSPKMIKQGGNQIGNILFLLVVIKYIFYCRACFWVMASCRSRLYYQQFRVPYCFHLQGTDDVSSFIVTVLDLKVVQKSSVVRFRTNNLLFLTVNDFKYGTSFTMNCTVLNQVQ
jgi:hypothetical protein